MGKIIITAIGKDRPGIVSSVAEILYQLGCNIENVSQTILQSEFAGIYIISALEGTDSPELTSCLEGITRDTVFELAAELGLTVRERRITRDEVYVADEAFFTGTAAEVLPIKSLDGRIIGNGARGPITEKLQTMYFDQVMGKRSEHPDWSTRVL